MARYRAVPLAAITAMFLSILPPAPALAFTQGCSPNRSAAAGTFIAGWHRTPPGGQIAQGVYAQMDAYANWLYANGARSVAYVGLWQGSNYGYIGWERYRSSSSYTPYSMVYEYKDGVAGSSFSWRFPDQNDNYWAYMFYWATYYDPVNRRLSFWYNNVQQASFGVNLLVPNQARNYSVIDNKASQMLGDGQSGQIYLDVHIRYGGIDYPFDGTTYSSNWNDFAVSSPLQGSGIMKTWDIDTPHGIPC